MTSRAALALAVLVAASLFACAPRPLGAADMPHPRAGLWTWVAANGRGDFCSSGQPVHIPDSTVACPSVTYAKTDKGVEITGVCGEGAAVSKIQMVFSGDFQAAYAVDTRSNLAIMGKTPIVSDMHAHFRFDGPCPPGRAADDLK